MSTEERKSESLSTSQAFCDGAAADVAGPGHSLKEKRHGPPAVKAVDVPQGHLPLAGLSLMGSGAAAAAKRKKSALQLLYNAKTSRGTTFLKDSAASKQTLPQLLPKGMPYVANFVSFAELKHRGALNMSRKDEVSITTDELRLLYQAKCVDQSLVPSWEREVRFMELISANCKGSFFSLPENGLGPASAEAIKHILSGSRRYSVLDLSGNRLSDEGAASIAELLRANRTLVHVGLSSNDIGHAGGTAIARALEVNNTVISLDLSAKFGMNGNHIGSTGAQAIGRLLQKNQVLWKLCLGSNGLGPIGLAHIAEGFSGNTHLTHLDLSGNSLGPEGAALLDRILSQGTLKWLSLQRNALGDNGGKIVFEAIAKVFEGGGGDSLEYLDMEANDLGFLSAKAIGKVLSVSTALSTLRLSGNLFTSTSPSASPAKCITDGICENKGLTNLSLASCGFREGDGAALGHCLAQNGVLTILDLSKNKLKDQGAKDLARGLAVNHSLLRVDLSSNKIGDIGGKELASSLALNNTLRDLNLRRNDMSSSTGDYLSEVLRGNNTVERMNVSYNDFCYKSCLAIQTMLERNAGLNKQLVVPRLNGEIEVLAPKERELSQVEEEIDMEKRIIKDRSEQILRRNEEARVVLEKMRRDVIELEKTVERARTSCEEAEEVFRRTEDRVTNETTTLKGKKNNTDTRIQQEKDRVDRMQRDMDKMRRQIKQIEEAEEAQLAPLITEVQQAEKECEREKQDAVFEAEKLASLALRKKELEIVISSAKGKKK